jgi:hypothetical protein
MKRRPRTVETSQHFCPYGSCRYRGWLGLGNLRANGHPSGGPWRQFHCTSCDSYFLETRGTACSARIIRAGVPSASRPCSRRDME